MKRIARILVVLFLVISGYVSAETIRIINTRNEYGGETKELVLTANDEGYKQGIAKGISYYDNNEKLVTTETYFPDDYARKGGIAKTIHYFDNKVEVVGSNPYS